MQTKTKDRAGVIPYIIDNGEIKMLFMVPSKEQFGHIIPQIAKGRVDPGENLKQAAFREGSEEIGLKMSNVSKVIAAFMATVTGNKEIYNLAVYICKVKNENDFNPHDHETLKTVWLGLNEFRSRGRASQLPIVEAAYKKILSIEKQIK